MFGGLYIEVTVHPLTSIVIISIFPVLDYSALSIISPDFKKIALPYCLLGISPINIIPGIFGREMVVFRCVSCMHSISQLFSAHRVANNCPLLTEKPSMFYDTIVKEGFGPKKDRFKVSIGIFTPVLVR